MPTLRLTPSTYSVSSTTYLSVSSASNMYDDTDSTNYATVTNSRSSTTSYYLFLKGFDFSQVPENAIINSFSVKLKAYESGGSTSSSYRPMVVTSGSTSTYEYYGYCDAITTSASVHTFTMDCTWEDLVSEGTDLSIRINCRRASRNTTSYFYIYGAEIVVDYTMPVSATVTSTLSGNGTISPSGATSTYEGAEYELTITPTNKADQVTAKKNGVDITSELVAHGNETTVSAVPSDVSTSGVQSGTQYAEYAVGHSAENPSSSGTSSNMYASSGSTGYAEYTFDFSSIPSGATIEDITVTCYGHRESATIDSSHVSSVAIYHNGSAISEEVDFPTTSNDTIEIKPTDMPSDANNLTIRHFVGYYGGLVLGATFTIIYSVGSGTIDHYTYTYIVDGDATIAVSIGGSVETDQLYLKSNGTWKEAILYRKVSGSWQLVSDPSTVLSTSANYVKGD